MINVQLKKVPCLSAHVNWKQMGVEWVPCSMPGPRVPSLWWGSCSGDDSADRLGFVPSEKLVYRIGILPRNLQEPSRGQGGDRGILVGAGRGQTQRLLALGGTAGHAAREVRECNEAVASHCDQPGLGHRWADLWPQRQLAGGRQGGNVLWETAALCI